MMRYRAATFLIRSVAPEIALGFQTTEEAIDITDKTQMVNTPASLTEAAMQAMAEDTESEDVPATTDPTVEYGENVAEIVSNDEKTANGSATLFND